MSTYLPPDPSRPTPAVCRVEGSGGVGVGWVGMTGCRWDQALSHKGNGAATYMLSILGVGKGSLILAPKAQHFSWTPGGSAFILPTPTLLKRRLSFA